MICARHSPDREESLERQLSLTDNIQMTLEKKLTESSKRENDIKISLESANTQIADVLHVRRR